jgi:membrane-associated phospholipid phosphatase
MKNLCPSETSGSLWIIWHYNSENRTLHSHRHVSHTPKMVTNVEFICRGGQHGSASKPVATTKLNTRYLLVTLAEATQNFSAFILMNFYKNCRSRGSAVGIATGYGLDDRGVGVRVPVGSRIFSSPLCPDRLWGLPNDHSKGYGGGSFPGGKAVGAWSWPLTSNYCRWRKCPSIHPPPYAFLA